MSAGAQVGPSAESWRSRTRRQLQAALASFRARAYKGDGFRLSIHILSILIRTGKASWVTRTREKGPWSVERRLEFIDFKLFWEGRVNRSDLVDYFGVSVPQASADLAQYQELAPANAVYDKNRKTYVAGEKFKPVFFAPSADRYLAQLRLIESGLLREEEAWAVRMPAYSIVPILRRHIDASTLRGILVAIRARAALHVRYQSMSRPQPQRRWISPHALGFDGFRWHARAWCHSRERFADFVLARFLDVGETRTSTINPADDIGWQREITLRFAPHPDLKGGKRKAIELDYDMKDGVAAIKTRVCLSYYLERQFGLDAEAPAGKGERQQIVLINREELEAARKAVRDACATGDGLREEY
ncbi:MAG: WYL domain-containing protein [Planctomycetia bacterium]|nr:WYL domain-containing protein [Planctomycetia bacterium]